MEIVRYRVEPWSADLKGWTINDSLQFIREDAAITHAKSYDRARVIKVVVALPQESKQTIPIAVWDQVAGLIHV